MALFIAVRDGVGQKNFRTMSYTFMIASNFMVSQGLLIMTSVTFNRRSNVACFYARRTGDGLRPQFLTSSEITLGVQGLR